jgi:glycine cleavage system H protein
MGESGLLYNADHAWVRVEHGEATVGLSDFAQAELGEIAYVELPEIGRVVRQGEPVGALDSMKSTSELYAPLSGTVLRVHEAFRDGDSCRLINKDPLGEGWLYVMAIADSEEVQALLTPEGYRKLLQGV